MRYRSDLQYSARVVTVIALFVILATPYMAVASLPTGSGEGYTQLASGSGTSLPKIDPQLRELIGHQTNCDAKIIVVLKQESDVGLIEEISRADPSFRLITRFEIIPAVLIEGPLNKISKLFSISEIRGVYLNKEFNVGPINKTLSSTSSMSPASLWIQAINTTPVRAITNGSGVTVAVLDSGIYDSHPDLAGKVVKNTSFVNTLYDYQLNESSDDYLGHGTYVAGIIAGGGIVSSAYEGVAPGVKLISVKCIDEYGQGFTAGIIKAIEWAVSQSCDVINLSIGGGAADPDDPISLAVDSAVRSGVVVVVSAGNGGPDYSTGSSPAAARLAISVGASNGTKSIADFSSRGPTLDGRPYPDVLAPGVDIVSTLASGSAIADYAERFDLPSGNYVSLGGTSASTPLVSGSVALLLSSLTQLRSVAPGESKVEIATTIRIALMRTANNSVGTDVNTYGSGIVNVGSAYAYLGQFSGSPYPILDVYPKTLINAPYLVGFLGDSFAVNLSLLTAYKASLNIAVSGNATQFIKLRNSTFTNIVGLTPINVNISIPVNATLGKYVAQIGFINTSSTHLITGENVTVGFTVKSPRGRLYFDVFHTDSTFSIRSDLYKLALRLTNESYSVYESDTPLTYSEISQYDILVLTDPQIMFGVEEVNAIHDFVAKNGSLLIFGNYYPRIAAEAVNGITARYGIQFNKDFIANYTDMVTGDILNSLINVTDLASHPVTTNVGSYLFGYGSSLSVNTSMATLLANTSMQWSNLPILAAYDSPAAGRVLVSGSMLFATDGYLLDKSNLGNAKLADNMINWLLRDGNMSVEVVAPSTRLKSGETFQIGLLVVNRTTGNLLGWNVTCTAINGSSIPVRLINSTNGIYYNMSLIFQYQGFYTLSVRANSDGNAILREFNLEVVNAAPEILNISLETYHNPLVSYPLPTYFKGYLPSGTPIISRFGDYVNITIKASGVDSGSNVTVYLTRYPDLYLSSDKPITYISIEAELVDGATHTYRAQYRPTLGNSTDIYFFWISADNAGHMSLSNEVGAIMVASIDPIINKTTSTINGRTLSDLGQNIYLTINTGDTVSVTVNGSDAEDMPRNMRAWAILLDLSLFRVPGFTSAELIISNLTFSSETSTFSGALTIPSSGSVNYTSDNRELLLVNRLFALVLLLVDSDGAYSMGVAYVWIVHGTEIPVALILTILLVSVAIPILVIILIERRTKKKLAGGPQPEQFGTLDSRGHSFSKIILYSISNS
nr:S8 family serine peptidase [Candidatus Njordarchaeum guaymaensis]